MTESTREHWDRFWTEGSKPDAPNKKIVQVISALGGASGWKVLEVGAGRGADSVFLAKNGADSYVLDFSKPALEKSREIAESNGVEINLVEGDAYDIPFEEGTFDLVFHQGFLEHFHEPEKLLIEQLRVMKPDGYIIVDVPQRYCLYTLKKKIAMRRGTWFAGWETEFGPRELEKLMKKCGFDIKGTYAWGMAASYGWRTRNAVHWIKRLVARSNGNGQALAGSSGNGSGGSISSRRPLLYLANNIGVVGRKK